MKALWSGGAGQHLCGGLMQRALGSARPRDSFAFYKPYSKIICSLALKAHFTPPLLQNASKSVSFGANAIFPPLFGNCHIQ